MYTRVYVLFCSVYIEHDGEGDEIKYYGSNAGPTGAVIGGDAVIDIFAGVSPNDGFVNFKEDRSFSGSVCYTERAYCCEK